MTLRTALLVALFANCGQPLHAESPYAGEQVRATKALSEKEIEAYLAGRGMGLARAAELNGYPGPMHVMELADELALSDEQRDRTARLFDAMNEEARSIGAAIVTQERVLDRLFAEGHITPDNLAGVVGEIALLKGRLRTVHLGAHLVQSEILTASQREIYAQLRGYGK